MKGQDNTNLSIESLSSYQGFIQNDRRRKESEKGYKQAMQLNPPAFEVPVEEAYPSYNYVPDKIAHPRVDMDILIWSSARPKTRLTAIFDISTRENWISRKLSEWLTLPIEEFEPVESVTIYGKILLSGTLTTANWCLDGHSESQISSFRVVEGPFDILFGHTFIQSRAVRLMSEIIPLEMQRRPQNDDQYTGTQLDAQNDYEKLLLGIQNAKRAEERREVDAAETSSASFPDDSSEASAGTGIVSWLSEGQSSKLLPPRPLGPPKSSLPSCSTMSS